MIDNKKSNKFLMRKENNQVEIEKIVNKIYGAVAVVMGVFLIYSFFTFKVFTVWS
jgi:hypothetical protein